MKTSVTVLTLCLFSLSVGEVQQLDPHTQLGNNIEIANIIPTSDCAGNATVTQEAFCKLATTVKELQDKVTNIEKELEDLKKEVKGKQVAFGASTGLSGNYGPFNSEVTMIYKNVFQNTGSYNSRTGIFTAPVKGVYYFSFTGHNLSTKPMGLRLMKNGRQVVSLYNHASGDRYETASNSMILKLNWGERVQVKLWKGTWIFDNEYKHSTFTGHLLFPL